MPQPEFVSLTAETDLFYLVSGEENLTELFGFPSSGSSSGGNSTPLVVAASILKAGFYYYTASKYLKKCVDGSAAIVELCTRAYENFKRNRLNRMALQAAQTIADTHLEMNNIELALKYALLYYYDVTIILLYYYTGSMKRL